VTGAGLHLDHSGVSGKLCPKLCSLSRLQENFDIINDSLDILIDVLGKFGHLLPEHHATVVQVNGGYSSNSFLYLTQMQSCVEAYFS